MKALLAFALLVPCAAGAEPPATLYVDESMPAPMRRLVQEDLAWLAGVRGGEGSALHRDIFGGPVDGSAYIRWLRERVQYINYSQCGGRAHGCVYDLPFQSRVLWLTASYEALDRTERVSVLMHEARHAEGPRWDHAVCRVFALEPDEVLPQFWRTSPSAVGERRCDESELGAYGVESVFLRNLGMECSNCDAGERAAALELGARLAGWVLGREGRERLRTEHGHAPSAARPSRGVSF